MSRAAHFCRLRKSENSNPQFESGHWTISVASPISLRNAEQDECRISLELLHEKTGPNSHSHEFKSMIRELVQNDHLPDYQVSLEDEMVIFRNRMTWQAPKAQPSYPVLDPDTYHDARLVAPS